MSIMSGAIGRRLERHIDYVIPGLEKINRGSRQPDFYCPSGNFWIEAKVGYKEWGPRLHAHQMKSFSTIKEPVCYALGFHGLKGSSKILKGLERSEMDSLLEKDMEIENVCFVNGNLIKKIWESEVRTSKNKKTIYFQLKKGLLRNIWERRQFDRFEKVIDSAEEYYGFNWNDFYMRDFDFNGDIYGAMLNSKEDGRIIEYLNECGLLKD